MNTMIKKIQVLPVGVLLLALALLMQRFVSPSPLSDFMEGLLFGLSLVLNGKIIVDKSRNKRSVSV